MNSEDRNRIRIQAKAIWDMLEADGDHVVHGLGRKVWKPNKKSASLVVTIPPSSFYEEGNIVDVFLTAKGRIIIQRSVKEEG